MLFVYRYFFPVIVRFVIFLCLLWPAPAFCAGPFWELAPGLSLARFKPDRHSFSGNLDIVVLKIDPSFYEFSVQSVSRPGSVPGTMRDWARSRGLTACINASMYREDGKTSTGMLRDRDMVNNKRVNKRFGAFFVFNPIQAGLPLVAMLDRYGDKDWESVLPRYQSVVQNYRMIGAGRVPSWPEDGNPTSIAAVGLDLYKMVLFVFSEAPYTPGDLSRALLELPLGVASLMYAEGGPPAGLYVSSGSFEESWTGGLQGTVVPSVLGIRPRAVKPKK